MFAGFAVLVALAAALIATPHRPDAPPSPPTIVLLGGGDQQTFGYAEFRIQNPGKRAILIQQGRPEVLERGEWTPLDVEVNWLSAGRGEGASEGSHRVCEPNAAVVLTVNWPHATPWRLSLRYQREQTGAAWRQRIAQVIRFRSIAVLNSRLWHPSEVVNSSLYVDSAPDMDSSLKRPVNTSLWDNELGRIRFLTPSTPVRNLQSPQNY